MSGPLAGIRVVDLCSVVSGPMCTVLLADQGADVIKVESLSGDHMRHARGSPHALAPSFISCNRGKRSIALDLKRTEGKAILWLLTERADVFAQNFRPGAIDRLGFGEPEVRAANPGVVYLSLSGVGERGPYASKRVYDPVIQALSGMADIQADPLTGRPRMIRTIVADKAAAIYAAQAVTAALLHRERSGGEGQHVKVAMLDTMVSMLWPEGMAAYTVLSDGDRKPVTAPHDMIFETADGYITVGAVSNAEWRGLCEALERPEWVDDERFATPAARSANRQERLEHVQAVLVTDTRSAWLERLERADVPCAPVLERRETIDDAQVRENDLIQEFEHPNVGRVRQARPAARFDATPAAIAGPAPGLGEHSREILVELGYDTHDIATLYEDGIVGFGDQS